MRTKEIIATVAITGAVATLAVLNLNSINSGKTLLATPFTEAEREFINFISRHHRSFGTKEEYEYRLSLFTEAFNRVITHDPTVAGFQLGLNKFADLSDFEYKQMLGYKPELR